MLFKDKKNVHYILHDLTKLTDYWTIEQKNIEFKIHVFVKQVCIVIRVW